MMRNGWTSSAFRALALASLATSAVATSLASMDIATARQLRESRQMVVLNVTAPDGSFFSVDSPFLQFEAPEDVFLGQPAKLGIAAQIATSDVTGFDIQDISCLILGKDLQPVQKSITSDAVADIRGEDGTPAELYIVGCGTALGGFGGQNETLQVAPRCSVTPISDSYWGWSCMMSFGLTCMAWKCNN